MEIGLSLSLTSNKGVGALRFTTSLPQSVSYSRTGAATAFTAAGAVVPFAANAPQLTDRGLLLEPAATNLLLRSQDFSHAVWDKGAGGAISADSVLAPDGTMTADAYTWATTTDAFAYLAQTISGNASLAVASAIYLKSPSGMRNVRLAISNVAVATVNGANMTLTTAWQRIPYAIAAAALANTGQIGFGLLAGSTNPVVAGEAIHVWQADLSASLSAITSPIFTTTAAATRGLPTATVPVPAGRTVARATYGLSNTVVDVTGLTPGASFDLVTGRPWVGLGNELKSLEWLP